MSRAVPPRPAPLFFVGVHGGAGASTIVSLAPGSTAVTRIWPVPPTGHGGQLPVVLVARSHLSGLTAAQHAITDWASGSLPGVELVGLVVIADAPGRLPRPLRDLIRLLAGGVPQLWQLPWSEAARLGQLNDPATAPLEHRAFLRELADRIPSLADQPSEPTPAAERPAADDVPPSRPTVSNRTAR